MRFLFFFAKSCGEFKLVRNYPIRMRFWDLMFMRLKTVRYPILQYLFNRHANNPREKKRCNLRVRFREKCSNHRGRHNSKCYVSLTFNPSLRIPTIYRRIVDFSSKQELIHSIFNEIVSKYYIEGKMVMQYDEVQTGLYKARFISKKENSQE